MSVGLFVKLDPRFPFHRKAVKVGPFGRLLYISALGYCVESLSDGFVPEKVVARLADVDDPDVTLSVTLLVTHKLWRKVDGGYEVHDYLEWQTSSKEVEAKREGWRRRKQKQRERDTVPRDMGGVTCAGVTPPEPEPEPEPESITCREVSRPKNSTTRKPKLEPKPRPRNLVFDALAAVHGIATNQITSSAGGMLASAAAQIREVTPEVTPDEIHRRACNLALHFPGAATTATSLAKHWGRCDRAPPGVNSRPLSGVEAPDGKYRGLRMFTESGEPHEAHSP